MKITDRDRIEFLVGLLHVVSIGADWRGPRKRSYTDWGMRSFRHWRKWKIGDDVRRIDAIDAAMKAESRGSLKK